MLIVRVLATGVTNEEYDELEGILAADNYLGVAANQTGNYYLTLLETPGLTGRDFPDTAHPHSVWRDCTADYGGKISRGQF